MTPPRRWPRLLLAFIATGWLAAPAWSIIPLKAPQPPDAAKFRALMADAVAAARADDCRRLLGLLDPVAPGLSGRDRVAAELLRIPCLGAAGRGREVAEVYRALSNIDPESGAVRAVGVVVAVQKGDWVDGGKRLVDLAERNPEALPALTGALVRGVLQSLEEARDYGSRDRLFVALARADWQAADRPDIREGLAVGAIASLLGSGALEEARTLLPRITIPELLVSMATERRYEPLWTAIEDRLGPHSAKAIDRFAAERLDAFARTPGDERAQRYAIHAFNLLGRRAEAVQTGAPIRIAEAIGEDAAAAVTFEAQALTALGRRGEAIERLRPFAALDPGRTPAAAGALITLAELLDEDGRPAEALSAARGALGRAAGTLSPWGIGWLRRTELCALGALGREAEARTAGEALRSDSTRNPAAAIEGLLCVGRSDAAAEIAVATLATAEGASMLIGQFQPGAALWMPWQSRLRDLWRPLLDRPDVRAAFQKAGRILPEVLWPTREPRPIPRRQPVGGAGPVA